jgi:hypothetical protein
MKTYIIVVQATDMQNAHMQAFVRNNPHIKAFWNYIPSVYCVKTTLRSAELRERVDSLFPLGGFFIGEVNAEDIDGRLPAEAWTWFYDAPPLQSPLQATSIMQDPFGTLSPKPGGLMSLGSGFSQKPQIKKKGLLGS